MVVSNRRNASFLLYNLNSVTSISGKSHFNPTVKNYRTVPHTGQISSSLSRAGADSFPHAGTSPNGQSWGSEHTPQAARVACGAAGAQPTCTASAHSTALPWSSCSQQPGNTAAPVQRCTKTAARKSYSVQVESDIEDLWKNIKTTLTVVLCSNRGYEESPQLFYFHRNYDTDWISTFAYSPNFNATVLTILNNLLSQK